MAKVVIEVDGKRHVLVKQKRELQPCNECSIYDICKRGDWICGCLTDGESGYIFEKDE